MDNSARTLYMGKGRQTETEQDRSSDWDLWETTSMRTFCEVKL